VASTPFPGDVVGVAVVPPLGEVCSALPPEVAGEEEFAVAVWLAGADVLVLAVAVLLAAALDDEEVVAEPGAGLELEHWVEVFCGADVSDALEVVAGSVAVAVPVALELELPVVLLLTLGLGLVLAVEVS
jgi:hypothetical protein